MNPRRDPHTTGEVPLARFLERVRKSFSHDLRTPLGTIVNYAAVLEASQGSDAEEVRDLGRRIRGNALRAARMIQLLATATGLAGRPLHAAPTDLLALARSVLGDANGRGVVRAGADTHSTLADVDAEVLGFAWRAYVAVENDARGKPTDEAELSVSGDADDLVLEVRCGFEHAAADVRPWATSTAIEVPAYLRHNGGPSRLECALGLGLAQDLVESHGGELHVWGRPGAQSALRLRFPTSA